MSRGSNYANGTTGEAIGHTGEAIDHIAKRLIWDNVVSNIDSAG